MPSGICHGPAGSALAGTKDSPAIVTPSLTFSFGFGNAGFPYESKVTCFSKVICPVRA